MTAQIKKILQIVSFAGLVLSVVPAILMFTGALSKEVYLHLMTAGMVLWFSTAVFWIRKDHQGE